MPEALSIAQRRAIIDFDPNAPDSPSITEFCEHSVTRTSFLCDPQTVQNRGVTGTPCPFIGAEEHRANLRPRNHRSRLEDPCRTRVHRVGCRTEIDLVRRRSIRPIHRTHPIGGHDRTDPLRRWTGEGEPEEASPIIIDPIRPCQRHGTVATRRFRIRTHRQHHQDHGVSAPRRFHPLRRRHTSLPRSGKRQSCDHDDL